MSRHDESLSVLNYMKTHDVLSFRCGAAGMLGFSALSDRVAWKATSQTVRARQNPS